MFDNILLNLVVWPIAAGVLCLFLPDRIKLFTKVAALLVSLAVLCGAIFVFVRKPLVYYIGSNPILLADNLSGFIALAVSVFGLLIVIYSLGFIKEAFGRYFGYTLMTLGSSVGVAFADSMIAFLAFWGFLAMLLYLLVNMKGTDGAASAAKKALIIIGGTDAVMIFGLVLIWSMTGSLAFSNVRITMASPFSYCAYLSLAIASFAKAGAVPFHSWLPDVAQNAPVPVTAYLPASLDKLLGIYLLAKASLSLFIMNGITNFILALAGSVTIVFAVIIALAQHDVKRLLGYHAVSQVGYMILGIGTGSVIGIAGALFHMLNNAIYKSCLFLTAGAVEKNAGTTDMAKLGGLFRYMPITFAACLVAAVSISGVPPFNGFVSKWMIYQGIIESASVKNPAWAVWLVAAMFGSALTVASFMKLLHSIFLGRAGKGMEAVKEAGFLMTAPMILLALVCVVFGIFAAGVPIALFISPALKGTILYCGIWAPIPATALVLVALALGGLAYILIRPGKFRTVSVFIGGEDVDKLERVTGTEFYNTVKEARGLEAVYRREEAGTLDIYNVFRKVVYYWTGKLARLHNGILPTYMVWCLLGMVGIFFAIFLR